VPSCAVPKPIFLAKRYSLVLACYSKAGFSAEKKKIIIIMHIKW